MQQLWTALRNMKIEAALASVEADRLSILSLIELGPGFAVVCAFCVHRQIQSMVLWQVNSKVRAKLQAWFVHAAGCQAQRSPMPLLC